MKLEERNISTLACVDDIILTAEKKEEMRSMRKRFSTYVEERKLELNAEKTEIMRSRQGGGRRDKRI